MDEVTSNYDKDFEGAQNLTVKYKFDNSFSAAFTVTVVGMVARIGATEYATLNAAIAAAANTGTSVSNPTEIVLLRNTTVPEAGMAANTGYTIPANKHIKLTVDAGENWTITASAGAFRLFAVSANASLNLDGTNGSLTLDGNNEAAEFNRQGVYVSGTLAMNSGVTITGFKNSSNGGGVFILGTFTMSGGSIETNSASPNGGGVYVGMGTFTMEGGTIYGIDDVSTPPKANTATGGGAVYVYGGTTQYGGALGTGAIGSTNNTLPPLNSAVKIGAAVYSTLADAIAAAPNTGTSVSNPTEIVLLRNITVPEAGMAANTGYTIPANKHIKLTVDAGEDWIITASAGAFRLFSTSSNSSLNLDGTNGSLTLDGNDEAAAANRQGVYVYGTNANFTMNKNITITGFNSTGSGGGVYVFIGGATFTMNGGTISGNTANIGGGVYVDSGTFTMNNGEISSNTTTGIGGGVYSGGYFTMSGGGISGNTASGGGGVWANGTNTAFIMNGGTISGNTASSGGGVYISAGGNFVMGGNSIISGNIASATGGGVYIFDGYFTMIRGVIYGKDVPSKANIANTTPNSAAVYVDGSGAAQYGGSYGTGAIANTDLTLPPGAP
jgi:hypothetical protein